MASLRLKSNDNANNIYKEKATGCIEKGSLHDFFNLFTVHLKCEHQNILKSWHRAPTRDNMRLEINSYQGKDINERSCKDLKRNWHDTRTRTSTAYILYVSKNGQRRYI